MRKLFLFFVALLATSTLWAYDFQSGDLYYNITSDSAPYTVSVTWKGLGNNNNYSLSSIYIPSIVTYKGISYNVTSIGPSAFSRCKKLTYISIPNSVTSIGDNAFYLSSLPSITIPSSVTSIGEDAFSECHSLTTITIPIPNCITSIHWRAFEYTSSITSVILTGSSVESFCQSTTNSLLNQIGIQCNRKIYIDGKEVTELIIPNSVTSIDSHAFDRCSRLAKITIPNSVASIDSYAFGRCSMLTEITIPNSVANIEQHAFYDCSSLTSIIWNATNYTSPSSYSYSPFYDICSQINSFTFGEDVKSIPAYLCYGMEKLQSITLPSSVISIGSYAFSSCSKLTEVTIPNSVTDIEQHAFYDCSSLTSVIWNATNYTSPSSYAESPFYGISSQITSFSIGENIKIIPAYLCCGMKSLPAITIPNSITNIGHCAFADCSSLKSIIIPDNVTAMGANVFGDCVGLHHIEWNVKSCTVYSDNEYVYPIFYGCENVESVTFGENVETIPTYLCYGMKYLPSIAIPNSVTDIEQNAFDDCSLLTSVIWNAKNHNNPSSPEESPFYGISSQITSFSIGENVETLPAYLCFGMKILPSITIPNNVTNIGQDAFLACIFLKENFINYSSLDAKLNDYWGAKFYDRELDGLLIRNDTLIGCKLDITSIILPNTITRIEDYAFSSCSTLTSVTIPESVTSIGEGAFYGCSTLTSIYLPYKIPIANKSSFNDYHYEQVKLYVPLEAYEAYKADDVWGKFKNIQYIDTFYNNDICYQYIIIGKEILSKTLTAEDDFNAFTNISITGTQTWHYSNQYGAKMSGYSDADSRTYSNEDWLISPAMDLSNYSSATLTFSHAFGPRSSIPTTDAQKAQYTCWVSNDFNGDVTTATWTEIPITYGTSAWSFITTTVDIPAENLKENCRIAWKYVCTNSSATWEIKSVEVGGSYTQPAVKVIAKNDKYSNDIVIPSVVTHNYTDYSVETIAASAFSSSPSLTSIIIGNNVKSVENNAFEGCSSLTSVILGSKVETIKKNAFSGCTALNEITLPASITSIGENAFAGCTKLYDVYCYAMEPPTAYESSFANYNAFLHVPCDNQRVYLLDVLFGNFKYIECIEAETATTDTVVVDPSFNDAEFTWPSNSNADSYTLAISKDGEVFCTLTFNANGQLTGIAFAPSRNGQHNAPAAEQAANGFTFTVTGLDEGSVYTYDLVIKDSGDNTLQTYSGEFRTQSTNDRIVTVEYDAMQGKVIGAGTYLLGDTVTLTATPNEGFRFVRWSNEVEDNPYTFVISDNVKLSAEFEVIIHSSVENTHSPSPISSCQKIFRNGQLLILRDGKTYNVMGQEM